MKARNSKIGIAALLALSSAAAKAWIIAAVVAAIFAIVFIAVIGPIISLIFSIIGRVEGRPLDNEDIRDGMEWRDRFRTNDQAAVIVPRDVMTATPSVQVTAVPSGYYVEESVTVFENAIVATQPFLVVQKPQGASLEWTTNMIDWIVWDGTPQNVDQAFWRVAK